MVEDVVVLAPLEEFFEPTFKRLLLLLLLLVQEEQLVSDNRGRGWRWGQRLRGRGGAQQSFDGRQHGGLFVF